MADEHEVAREGQDDRGEGTPAPGPEETLAGETAKLPQEEPRPDRTEQRPPAEPAPQRKAEEAGLRDVAGTLGRYLRGRLAAAVRLVRGHRLAASAVALALVVAAIAAVALATAGQGLPAAEIVEQDALSRLKTPAYSSGNFGRDDVIVAREVEVRSTSQGDDADHARAEVLVTYSGSYVQAEQAATLSYVRSGSSWVADGDPSDVRVSWSALADPDPDKIVSNVDVLLAQADRQLEEQGADGGTTLEQLYADAEVSLDLYEADPAAGSCSAEITCTRAGVFESYECHLSVGLAFRSGSGQWEVERLSVADGGKTRSLEPLVGTWQGSFARQETDGTKCLAGRSSGLTLRIDGAVTENGVSQVTGTLSGVAHYHEHPSQDAASCPGDLEFSDVPVTATLTDDSGGTLVLEATLPEDVDGTVSLVLRLGQEGSPSAATAEVTTSYPHTGTFLFIPYDETLTYTDVFSLTRAE